jgi:hypothetical protein
MLSRAIGTALAILGALGVQALADPPPENPPSSAHEVAGPHRSLSELFEWGYGDSHKDKSQRLLSSGCGLFKLGQPDQVVPPPIGWTVIVPPLPYLPRADAVPTPGPPMPWKPLFFANDFGYVADPESPYRNTFDVWKRIPLPGDRIVHEFGGEFRWQGRGEDNRRLTGEQNNFNLFRERLYLSTWFFDRFRSYWEVYWADASEQTVPPVFTDVDHGDVLNAFGELRLLRDEDDDGWWSFRYGWREELLFGNQRLVSPLDWANARRTFDLMPHLLYRGKTWAVDAFWSRPNVILPRALNQPNYAMQFFGTYLTYLGRRNQIYDAYYLGALADESNVTPFNGERGALQVHTLGIRWQGIRDEWLWEGEAAYQFGVHRDAATGRDVDRNAGMVTAGAGRRFSDLPLEPELWFYFDFASGDPRPGSGSYSTFNQLFPLGHKYFGYMDIVGRQNILDPNVNLKLNLGKRANLLLWYHNFHLASARDALYNAAGTPIRRSPLGTAGRYVGDELDVVLTFVVNPNSDWQFGLSHFWAGPFVQQTATTPAQAEDGSFFYTQFTVRF